jgi:hypothetical protein
MAPGMFRDNLKALDDLQTIKLSPRDLGILYLLLKPDKELIIVLHFCKQQSQREIDCTIRTLSAAFIKD